MPGSVPPRRRLTKVRRTTNNFGVVAQNVEPLRVRPAAVGAWTATARRILEERYLARDAEGRLETPEDMCWRVATSIAEAEARWGLDDAAVHEVACSFFALMVDRVFLPNSPTLMNAGRSSRLQYSACYVLPVGDSME